MSAPAPGFNGNDDDVDGALRTAVNQFHADLREQARIDASHFATYATIYRAAEALTSRDCGPVAAATKRDETFAWHLRSVAGEFACDSQLTDGALMNRARVMPPRCSRNFRTGTRRSLLVKCKWGTCTQCFVSTARSRPTSTSSTARRC